MAKNHIFKFRVTQQQYKLIRQLALSQGYVHVASYLREIALSKNHLIESKIIETNQLVKRMAKNS